MSSCSEEESPEVLELFEVLKSLRSLARPFRGVVVRSVGIKYATKHEFFSGVGAAKVGGRWNPVGLPAVYTSLDVLTATQEAYQNFVTYGFPLSAIQPRVTAGARLSLELVLDFHDPNIRTKIGFTLSELIQEDWKAIQWSGEESWTQAIGRGCFLAGFEAIVVPSAHRSTGKNMVIFPDNWCADCEIEILAADQLAP